MSAGVQAIHLLASAVPIKADGGGMHSLPAGKSKSIDEMWCLLAFLRTLHDIPGHLKA